MFIWQAGSFFTTAREGAAVQQRELEDSVVSSESMDSPLLLEQVRSEQHFIRGFSIEAELLCLSADSSSVAPVLPPL